MQSDHESFLICIVSIYYAIYCICEIKLIRMKPESAARVYFQSKHVFRNSAAQITQK